MTGIRISPTHLHIYNIYICITSAYTKHIYKSHLAGGRHENRIYFQKMANNRAIRLPRDWFGGE